MTSGRTIDYEALAQDAMRGVVRQVLTRVAKAGGLPGDHHFYISFDTQLPGVVLSKRLKEKYPEEMTIVLQHRFWDLLVNEERFEVKLTFDGIPERLVIPFESIKVFFDPSVRYGLQFEEQDWAQEGGAGQGGGPRPFGAAQNSDQERPSQGLRSGAAGRGKRPVKKPPRLERVETSAPLPVTADAADPVDGQSADKDDPARPVVGQRPAELKPVPATPAPGSAQVVSLSDFRKK